MRSNARQEAKGLGIEDLSCVFKVGAKLENDVLLRCRHFASERKRISMFRICFHTSFVSAAVVRFSRVLAGLSV